MFSTGSISQEELEQLLKDSREIAQDWNTYLQFRRNRDAVLREFITAEGVN